MSKTVPLAARMRPQKISDVVGQQHLLAQGKPLSAMLDNQQLYSMILWGPSGSGKTTLARLLAKSVNLAFEQLSAISATVKDIREVVQRAQARKLHQESTLLFVDEVHRFNKSQQDAFLPYVEDGTLVFIGATTENPSFELNYALLSRVKVFTLERLSSKELEQVLDRALSDPTYGYNSMVSIEPNARDILIKLADGDARRLLNRLELVATISIESNNKNNNADSNNIIITNEHISSLFSGETRRFDKGGDSFYEQISALHKSIRGSDPDAALYWLCRMLDGGCDPLYLARRLTRVASEDIGNADPRALSICLDAWEVQKRLGSPEGELALAQAAIYLSVAAKSNSVYKAFNKAYQAAKDYGSLEVPKHLRNAPTKLMQNMGYGKHYKYAHDYEQGYVAGESYFPDNMPKQRFYEPIERGLESKIKQKLEYLRSLNTEKLN